MGIKLIKEKGRYRPHWYAQYLDCGKWHVIRLTTPIRGTIPRSLNDKGDTAFENSRLLAQAEYDKLIKDSKSKGAAENLTRELIESKTGKKVEYVRLDELPVKWRTLSRSYVPTEKHLAKADLFFTRFAEHAKVTYLYEVSQDMTSSFFNKMRAEYSWSTVKSMMTTLKSAFARFLPSGMTNPFASVIKRNRELNAASVHRRPLNETELQALFDEAKKDPMLNALTVTAACTGMRIGDVCNLKWESVDLKGGFVTVLTAKAGQWVTIPIFDPFRKVLETALCERTDSCQYVFPAAAQMYAENPTGITHRGKVLFARALFRDPAKTKVETIDTCQTSKTPAEILNCIRNAGYTKQKTERVEKVYTLYAAGLAYRQIERETGLSRGQIGDYLHGIEEITGNTIVKYVPNCATSNRKLMLKTRQERKVGKCAASLYGWHSLRASFVVAALTHGIPVEVVRKVVGHATVAMTEEYFNPTKSIIAETMRRKMRDSVIGGGNTRELTNCSKTHAPVQLPTPVKAVNNDEIMTLATKLAGLSHAERERLNALLSDISSTKDNQ